MTAPDLNPATSYTPGGTEQLTPPPGALPPYITAVDPEARTQAQRRRDRNARDQHGRVWLVTLEMSRGGIPQPCSTIHTVGWTDPLRTPQRYLRLGVDEFGEVATNRLVVQWPEWIPEQQAADREWYDWFWSIAALKYPGGIEPKAALKNPWLVKLAGPRPWPRPTVLEAARDGHAGFLGLRPLTAPEAAVLGQHIRVDDLLAEIMADESPPIPVVAEPTVTDVEAAKPPLHDLEVLTYQDFFKDGRRRGLSITECAALWREHKAALQEG